MAVCYRHPGRETGVSCSSCGRPICPDCMTPTSVGMRCPECSRERTKVRTVRQPRSAPVATQALIAVNVVAFIVETVGGGGLALNSVGGGQVLLKGGLAAQPIALGHEYWRIITSGFLHEGLLHIGLNMLFLYILGGMLEPAIGSARFVTLYFVSLLAGALGALIVTPDSLTVGASGAGFGVLGATIVVARDRGISLWESGLGATLLLNVAFTFSLNGISIGGHVGGLIGGMVSGAILVWLGERRGHDAAAYGLCAVLAVAVVLATIGVARSHVGLPLL